jgi:hypothetical protein
MLITKGSYHLCHPFDLARLVPIISEMETYTYKQIYTRIYNLRSAQKGPIFEETVKYSIPREPLVEKIRQLITPAEESRLYRLIIGERHGSQQAKTHAYEMYDIGAARL